MTRPPAWVCWAALAGFLAELILAVLFTEWYVDLLMRRSPNPTREAAA